MDKYCTARLSGQFAINIGSNIPLQLFKLLQGKLKCNKLKLAVELRFYSYFRILAYKH